MKRTLAGSLLICMLTVAGGGVLWWQWISNQAVRLEAVALREETRELDQLRAENWRLKAAQIPESELGRLRADHAALPRLRAELEALKQRAAATGR